MKRLLSFLLALVIFFSQFSLAQAQSGQVLGVHILNIYELDDATTFLDTSKDEEDWRYVTVLFNLNELDKAQEWQNFFNQARQKRIIPLVRLVTSFEDEAWKVPNRKEIVEMVDFLNQLQWPTEQKHIIVFNEVNHAAEWGGEINPVTYSDALRFTSNWAHALDKNFIVMPAALDLAAPNGRNTIDAFSYWNQMYQADSEIFSYIDVWNSHSYPNPGFSGSPTAVGQNSLRGFQYELAWLKDKTDQDYQVFITETGWIDNSYTNRWLESYYTYALQHIWSDPRIIAVTPFVLKGDPGPFSGFSLLDSDGQPTHQYLAVQKALENIAQELDS